MMDVSQYINDLYVKDQDNFYQMVTFVRYQKTEQECCPLKKKLVPIIMALGVFIRNQAFAATGDSIIKTG